MYTDDFTEIDEDEILMDLAKAKGSDQLLLTIVPEETPWNGSISPETASAPSSGTHEKFLHYEEFSSTFFFKL